jgi:hypothetical protein
MTDRQNLQGNPACALGAIAAGCRFYGGYPIGGQGLQLSAKILAAALLRVAWTIALALGQRMASRLRGFPQSGEGLKLAQGACP